MKQSRNWAASFFTIWTGQAFSLLGSRLAQFALVWWVTETTGSATVLATATLAALLPEVLLGPFVGALVDRWNRRRMMMIADGCIALLSLWVVYLFWSGSIQVWHIYLIMVGRSLGGVFHWPAMQSSTSLMVPKEQLARVAGMNQTLFGALNIVAPPLGALLMSLLPLYNVMAIDVVTALMAIVPLAFISIPQPAAPAERLGAAPFRSLWTDVKAGFGYIWNWKGLLGVCLLAMLLNFFVSPAMQLLPILVTTHFKGAALQLGWLESGWGVGLLSGGLILAVFGGFKRRIVMGMLGIIGLGIGVFLVGLTPAQLFPMAIGGLFFGGVMNALCNGSFMAVMQGAVVPEMQGRVFTVVSSLTAGMMPVSMALAGPFADAVGVRTLFIVGGVAQIILGIAGFFIPAIMRLEEDAQAIAQVREALESPEPILAEREGVPQVQL